MKLKILKFKIPIHFNLNSIKKIIFTSKFLKFKFDSTIFKNACINTSSKFSGESYEPICKK